MNELRWILIVLGVALLAGIYAWGRRKSQPDEDAEPVRAVKEPQVGRASAAEPRYEPQQQYSPDDHADEAGYEDDEYAAATPVLDDEPEQEWPLQAAEPITAARQSSPRAPLQRGAAPDSFDDSAHLAPASHAEPSDLPDYRRVRREPTLGDAPASVSPTARGAAAYREPAITTAPEQASTPSAPREAAAPRRPERRKILALRLSLAPQGVEGGRLLELFQEELLEHGRYHVFHRLHEDGEALFSIASMIEPGTFDPEQMHEVVYPGVTLFTQLPGPVAGMHALNEMVSCARRLQLGVGGVLQDDRGVTLTEHRVERMREEVREFERPAGARGAPGIVPSH